MEKAGEGFRERPAMAGGALLEQVEEWYKDATTKYGFEVELDESSHLVLLYDAGSLTFRLFQYRLSLPDPGRLDWSFPLSKRKNATISRRLIGQANGQLVIEWYPFSGGQLKYYPLVGDAHWSSSEFVLEAIPLEFRSGIVRRAQEYFGEIWPK